MVNMKLVTIACVVVFCVAAFVRGDAIRVQVPSDAPVGLPAVIGVRYAPAAAGSAGAAAPTCFRAGGAVPADTAAQFVADLEASGRPGPRGTLWLPIEIRPEHRGKTLDVTLATVPSAPDGPVSLRVLPDQATEFLCGKRVVLRYNHGPRDLDGKEDPNAVLGFIHPIIGLDGEILTQNMPADHLHHRGLFWAWPRLKRGETLLGNWWERKDVRYRLGRIVRREAGPTVATMTAEGFWDYQTTDMARPERVVREVVTLRVFGECPAGKAGYQAFDVDVELWALADGLTMAGTEVLNKGYGGFTFRWPRPKTVHILADGKEMEKDGLLYRATWADCSGDFPAPLRKEAVGESGVAILAHPSHPGSPPPWLFRYYGVLNVSYPGMEYVPLHRDKPLRLSYRVILHRGTAAQARIADLYRLYATDWGAAAGR